MFAILCYGFMMLAISQSTDGWLEDRILPFTGVFVLGAVMMIAFGYTLGGILPGRRNWTAVITLIGLAFWFFSDILFQASQHALARPISLLLPPTYLTDALRQIATGKPGTFPLYVDILMMVSILILSSLISLRFFRYDTNDDRL
jgi:ABC-2 type transport system permease protein